MITLDEALRIIAEIHDKTMETTEKINKELFKDWETLCKKLEFLEKMLKKLLPSGATIEDIKVVKVGEEGSIWTTTGKIIILQRAITIDGDNYIQCTRKPSISYHRGLRVENNDVLSAVLTLLQPENLEKIIEHVKNSVISELERLAEFSEIVKNIIEMKHELKTVIDNIARYNIAKEVKA